jgi:hypothetical protein
MFLAALTVTFFPPQRSDPGLEEKVKSYLMHEPPEAAMRLSEPQRAHNKRILSGFVADPGFHGLHEDLRSFVLGRLKEIEQYEAYWVRLLAAMAPGDTRTLEDLEQVEQGLRGELALPSAAWAETTAGRLREKWLADGRAIRDAERGFLKRYEDFTRRGRELLLKDSFGGNWRADTNALFAEGTDPPPPSLAQPLPDSPALDLPRGEPVPARVPFEFERVYHSRREWDNTRQRLTHLRDLADALGLTAGPERPESVLVLPEPGPGVDSAALPSARWTALLRGFDRVSDDYREWQLENFWDPGRSALDLQLRHSFEAGARHVKGLLRARLGPNAEQKDTPEAWKELAAALGDPGSAFPDWGRLLHLLARLRNPKAPNPVAELFAFLNQTRFELDLQGFDVRNPSMEGATPTGPLVVTQSRGDTVVATKRFKRSDSGSTTNYAFVPETDGKLTYQPGDRLRVELPMRAGDEQFSLVWESGNSKTFQFDRLEGEPRRVKPDGGSVAATNVKLTPRPGSKIPELPVLFPELRR